jgi:hypothetical protein
MALFSLETAPVRSNRYTFQAVVTPAISAVFAPLIAVRRTWSRYRTERILEGLPAELRKDIGYPSSGDNASARRR